MQEHKYESWVKKIEKSSSDWFISDNTLIVKNAIFVFPRFCQVVQKHKLFEVA